MLYKTIAMSVILGFLSSELLGVATGGLVSAGYLAFFMGTPARVAGTLVISVVIYLVALLLQKWIIIYGRRRFMVVILLSVIFTWAVEQLTHTGAIGIDIRMVGFIIPGLIANDMLRQGVVRTLAGVLIAAVLIRLVMLTGIL
ncbi:MAG: poly-gamma-glutamate biosynthesis protein PgsC [Spirochaetales bacterium]|nr:poly-gamma-glutamate biosynthesis protein PgsC [Spirochaetales bacterium]